MTRAPTPVRPAMLADARGVLFDARHCVRLDSRRRVVLPMGGGRLRRSTWATVRRHLVVTLAAALDPRFAAGVVIGVALLATALHLR